MTSKLNSSEVYLCVHLICVYISTISIDSLKRNDPNFTSLKSFFELHFGQPGTDELADAKANFVESLAVSIEILYHLLSYDITLLTSESNCPFVHFFPNLRRPILLYVISCKSKTVTMAIFSWIIKATSFISTLASISYLVLVKILGSSLHPLS